MATAPETRIGFVGLGTMGGNMAARFLAAGYRVYGEQRDRAGTEGLVNSGRRCSTRRSREAFPRCRRERSPSISLAVQMLAFAEGLLLATRAGIDPALAVDVMTNSPIGSPMQKARAALILDVPDAAWFNIGLMQKDIVLALDAARQLRVPLPSAAAADEVLTVARGLGYERRDLAALFEVLGQLDATRPLRRVTDAPAARPASRVSRRIVGRVPALRRGTRRHEIGDRTVTPTFLLQRVQPALTGLIDGSLSTLAPIFAVALATHQPRYAFLAGLATAIGAGVSMAFSEGLSDSGVLTGRGNPYRRGAITGAGTFTGGILHTLPFLIPQYQAALIAAVITVTLELLVLA